MLPSVPRGVGSRRTKGHKDMPRSGSDLELCRKLQDQNPLGGRFSDIDCKYLKNDMDYSLVFGHISYYVCSYYIKLLKWPPMFDILVESLICSYLDLFPRTQTPLPVDIVSTVGSRPSVTGVLVELDITKQYPNSIWLGPKKYGYIKVFCDHCKTLGHSEHECYHLNPCLRKISSSKPKFVDATVVHDLSAQTIGVPNEINKNIIKTNCKPPTEGNSVPTNPLIQATPNVVIDLILNSGPIL
ncbi:hypothetical protein IEQ34_006359 [Dendrobium chrysotoxum]|uniref:Uncharacterized protein n=1 Tax=Dendrobium chrysotoxum TaxID=161865 RepID=A0AAV7HBH2_DENCH|nr:hypothetical protein IEQ34_006359 [Dendrobium chrysotoxum]